MLYSLIGKKIGMTQVYGEDRRLIPVTVIEAGPCPVTQVKTTESDGYNAIQIGFGAQKEHRLTAAAKGHLKKAKVDPVRTLKEVRCEDAPEQKVGDVLTVEGFAEGDSVDIIGVSKGKGFHGVIRRYRFAGGPAAHGSMFHRRGGSYGMRQTPGEVFKGKKMPGHMGSDRRTVQNLEVVKILADKNLILVKGSIPGANGDEVIVRSAKKKQAKTAA